MKEIWGKPEFNGILGNVNFLKLSLSQNFPISRVNIVISGWRPKFLLVKAVMVFTAISNYFFAIQILFCQFVINKDFKK